MSRLTIRREFEITKKRLEELELATRNNRTNLKEIRRLQGEVNLLKSKIQNLINRINNLN